MEKEFSYRAKLAGTHYAGELRALTIEDARKQLERMSYTDIDINDVGASKAQIKHAQEAMKPQSTLDAEKKVSDMIGSFNKDFTKLSPCFAAPSKENSLARKEAILVGGNSIIDKANEILLTANGTVKNIIVTPDHLGKMNYVIVIEQDIKEDD